MKNFLSYNLNKTRMILLILFLFSINSSIFAQRELLPRLIKKIKPSVVAVVIFDRKNQQIAQGSGFFIAANRVITNRHVIEDADHALIKTHDGGAFVVQGVLAASEEDDLALLQINVPANISIYPLPLKTEPPEEGEQVLVIGNPLGLEGTISDGLISSIRELEKSKTILQITAPISPGSSGSPVIDLRGEVVGIATSQLSKGQNLNFAMPSARIADLRLSQLKSLLVFTGETEAKKLSQANRLVLQGRAIIWAALTRTATEKKADGSFKFDPEAYEKAQAKAFPLFKQATELAPKLESAWEELAGIYKSFKKYQEAVATYRTAISLNQNSESNYFSLAGCYAGMEQYQLAVETYQKFINITRIPKMKVMAATFAGNIYFNKLNNDAAAIEAYHQGLGILKAEDPADLDLREALAAAYAVIGLTLAKKQKYSEALFIYQEILPLKTKYDALVYNWIGEVYMDLRQLDNALGAVQRAISLNPGLTQAHINLGSLRVVSQDNAAAITSYKKAISLEPDNVRAHFHLGMTYVDTGNRSAALEEYKILKTLAPKVAEDLFAEIYK